MADMQDELLTHHYVVRVAAVGVLAAAKGVAVVGADKAVVAVLLQAFGARRALLAAVHHATDADDVADLESVYLIAYGADAADDFMARYRWVYGGVPDRKSTR